MKKKIISSILHVLLFVLIEILFVFLILHEFPKISFFEKIWIIHIIYWICVFIAWYVRENIEKYQVKFIATFIPVLIHIIWHLYIWEETINQVNPHSEHSALWLIISTISLWIFIFIWEFLLHRKYHCEHAHQKVHKNCIED